MEDGRNAEVTSANADTADTDAGEAKEDPIDADAVAAAVMVAAATAVATAAAAEVEAENDEEIAEEQDNTIDIVEKAVFSLQAMSTDSDEQRPEDEVENHPVLDDGLVVKKFKKKGIRVLQGRRFLWVDGSGLHWVNSARKPAIDRSRGKVMPLSEIDHVTADNGGDPFSFCVHGRDKTVLTFKIPTPRGRTTDQAKAITTFWIKSLQKLLNSLTAVGRLVNGTEPAIVLTKNQQKLRRKMEKTGVLVVRKLATKSYFKWFHRVYLEDGVLYFVKACLLTAVVSRDDVEILYETETIEEDRAAAQAAREAAKAAKVASRNARKARERAAKTREKVQARIMANREAARKGRPNLGGGGFASSDSGGENNDGKGGGDGGDSDSDSDTESTASTQPLDVNVGETADDIDTAQLYCVTREAPAVFSLATAVRGFKGCPILPRTDKDLKRMSLSLVHTDPTKSVNFIIPTRAKSSKKGAVAAAEARTADLLAVLRHQMQRHVPSPWLQRPSLTEASPKGQHPTTSPDQTQAILEKVAHKVNTRRLRTMFELTGRGAELTPKIPQLLAKNKGNEEALFQALSTRYGCTVTPYRQAEEHLLGSYRALMGPNEPQKRVTAL